MAGRLQKIKRLIARTVYAEDEKVVGRHTTGQDIIERTYIKQVAEDVLDGDGKQVWKVNHMGVPISKVRRMVDVEVTETYVYDDVGGGHNQKNFDFRPPPEVLKERERIAGIAALKESYFERAYDRGETADDMHAREEKEEPIFDGRTLEGGAGGDTTVGQAQQDAQDAAAAAIEEAEERAKDKPAADSQQDIKERKARAAKARAASQRKLRAKQKKEKQEMAEV